MNIDGIEKEKWGRHWKQAILIYATSTSEQAIICIIGINIDDT